MNNSSTRNIDALQRALKSNATFQSVSDMLDDNISNRTIVPSYNDLSREQMIKILNEYDELLFNIESINHGFMTQFCGDEFALGTALTLVREHSSEMYHGTTKNQQC